MQLYTSLHNLCSHCHEIVNWKLQFGKYKKLTQPGKCNICQLKSIVNSYRNICDPCAKTHKKCAKCMKSVEKYQDTTDKHLEKELHNEKMTKLKNLLVLYKERSRRKLERLIDKELVILLRETFIYKESGLEVENLKLKTEVESEDSMDFEDSDCSYMQ